MRTAREALARQLFDGTAWSRIRARIRSRSPATQPTRPARPSPATLLAAGDGALARADYDTAVRCMYLAVDLDPTQTDSLRCLAVALVAAKRFDEAIPVYESLLGAAPEDRTARFNLALALARVLNFRRAELEYRRLVESDERFVQAWYNLATLHQAQGKLDDAQRTWRKVLALAPHLPSAHACLAEVLLDLGRAEEAMGAYAEAAKLSPNEVAAWVNLASAAERAGSYGRAVVALQKAARLAPEDADVHARLGNVLIELHRATNRRVFLLDAVAAWRESVRLDPTQQALREKLRRYEPLAATRPATH